MSTQITQHNFYCYAIWVKKCRCSNCTKICICDKAVFLNFLKCKYTIRLLFRMPKIPQEFLPYCAALLHVYIQHPMFAWWPTNLFMLKRVWNTLQSHLEARTIFSIFLGKTFFELHDAAHRMGFTLTSLSHFTLKTTIVFCVSLKAICAIDLIFSKE